jgi:hypothetical protein
VYGGGDDGSGGGVDLRRMETSKRIPKFPQSIGVDNDDVTVYSIGDDGSGDGVGLRPIGTSEVTPKFSQSVDNDDVTVYSGDGGDLRPIGTSTMTPKFPQSVGVDNDDVNVYSIGDNSSGDGVDPRPIGTSEMTHKFPPSVDNDDVIDITDDGCDSTVIDKYCIEGMDVFSCICSFLLFVWLFFFTYALEDRFFNTPRLLFV